VPEYLTKHRRTPQDNAKAPQITAKHRKIMAMTVGKCPNPNPYSISSKYQL